MPGLLRGIARTAVVAGTASHVAGNVQHRQQKKWARKDSEKAQQNQGYGEQMPAGGSADATDYQLEQLQKLGELKANGIGPQDILIRVAELVAFMETNPSRLKSQREEDFALARNVMHLTPRNLRGRRHGAKVMQHLGPLIREHCYVWAGRFVRRLREDRERVSELKRQAMDYD